MLATAPKAGTELLEGATVRVNVSKGPKPITVPNVIGSAFESAQSTLQGAGFAVAREEVEDPAAAGTVVGQNPAAGTQQSKGSVITLQVSSGPQTSQIPDVTSQTEADARAQLEQSGFEVQVVEEIVDDESLDGRVLSQDPEGGSDAEQGTTVVIVVGRFEEAPPGRRPRRPRRPRSRDEADQGGRRRRRALERARDLARVGALGAGGARSGAVRDDDDRDRPRRPVGARGGPSNRLFEGEGS